MRNPDESGFGSVQHPDKSRFAFRICRICPVCEIRMNPDFHVEREKYGLRSLDNSECEILINPDVALSEIRICPDAESGEIRICMFNVRNSNCEIRICPDAESGEIRIWQCATSG